MFKKTIENVLRILNRHERSRMLQLIILDLVISLLDLGFLVALIYVVHFYSTGGHSVLFSFFPFTLFAKYPLSLILMFFLLFTLKNWLGYVIFKNQCNFLFTVASRLSKNNLLRFLRGPYDAHVDINSSVHINNISRHPVEFSQHILGGIQQIAGQGILITLTTIAILIYNPTLFLLLLIILTPPVILVGVLIKRKLNTVRRTAKPVHEKTLQHLQEALAGYIESNVFAKDDFFVNRYSTHQTKFNDFLSKQLTIQNLPYKFMEVFAVFGLLLLIVINFYSSNSASIGIIAIGTFMAGAYKIIPGIARILNSLGQLKTYHYTVAGLLESGETADLKTGQPLDEIATIAMENICFDYQGKPVLNNFSMELTKGDFVGLSGTSGKGKTTIINILLGFLEPHTGNAIINNRGISTVERRKGQKRMSYVKQDMFLIHDSILTNITLDDRPADEPRLKNIVSATGLDTLTSAYPEGLNKVITENGRNLSGGQKQRIIIARALYKDADLIILDEPFNELDRPSENKLLEYCRILAASGKIIILVTHNRESLSYCSKIISLDEA